MKKKIENSLLNFYKWNKSKWFIFSCLHTLSAVWFSLILSFFGKRWGLIDVSENNDLRLTPLGFTLTIVTVSWTLFCFVAQRYSEWYESNTNIYKPSGGEVMLHEVNNGVISICKNKISNQIKQIHRIKNGEACPLEVQGFPCEQLGLITSELSKNLAYLLSQKDHNVRADDITVRIFYNFPMENPNTWKIAENRTTNTNVDIDNLLSQNTTFSTLLKSDGNFIFYNKKERAVRENSYIPVDDDERNENHHLLGSIMGHRTSLGYGGEEYIRFMLFVSTYSKCFLDEERLTAEELNHGELNIHHHVIDEYVRRIAIELESLYMIFLSKKTSGR